MKRWVPLLVALACPLATLSAQQPSSAVGRALQRQLADRQRMLVEKRSESERLLDLLVRSSLGLGIGDAGTVPLTDAERMHSGAELEQKLAETLRGVAELGTELDHARARLEGRRAKLTAAATDAGSPPATQASTPAPRLTVPPVAPLMETGRPPETVRSPGPAMTEPATATPRSTGASSAAPEETANADPGPAPVLLSGTDDASLLGRALFHAGQLERARDQLEKVAQRTDAPLLDLFALARTYEGLTDYARADSTYLRIEEADTARQPDGSAVAGPWAAAARAARQHMAWMRENAGWRLVLPGEETR